MKLITEKLFRKQENLKKAQFILTNCDISIETIQKAAVLATKPPYHTFGHALGAAEQVIRIAQAETRTRGEINLLVIAMLFHDAGHKGIVRLYDEMYSYWAASEVLVEADTESTGMSYEITKSKLRDLILATTFSNRGKTIDPLAAIVQDADLAHLGLGVAYWLWASMGLVDEFNLTRDTVLTPQKFIWEEQEKFIDYLLTISKTESVYLSEGGKKIFRNSKEDVQALKKLSAETIQYAYDMRREDITVEDFQNEIEKIEAQK